MTRKDTMSKAEIERLVKRLRAEYPFPDSLLLRKVLNDAADALESLCAGTGEGETDLRSEICEIISEMLDHPDKHGIYPTTRCFDKLEAMVERRLRAALSEREGMVDKAVAACELEYVGTDETDGRLGEEDEAYNRGVRDCINAIRALSAHDERKT